jgi:hypothetical protein
VQSSGRYVVLITSSVGASLATTRAERKRQENQLKNNILEKCFARHDSPVTTRPSSAATELAIANTRQQLYSTFCLNFIFPFPHDINVPHADDGNDFRVPNNERLLILCVYPAFPKDFPHKTNSSKGRAPEQVRLLQTNLILNSTETHCSSGPYPSGSA